MFSPPPSAMPLFRDNFLRAAAPFTLVLGLTFSALLTWQAVESARETDRLRFDRLGERLQSEIARRIRQYEYGLRGAAALWPASKSVERGEFSALVNSHDLATEFPGALGIGFIKRVNREDLPAFLAATRADDAPNFQLKTSGDSADLFVIEFIEPLAFNQAVQGYDVGQEHTRRAAATRAMLSGLPALSHPIILVQAKDEGPAFLIFYPVYKNVSHPTTPEERRTTLLGWTYMPIVASRIFSVIDRELSDEIEFQVYDGESSEAKDRIYDGYEHVQDAHGAPAATPALFAAKAAIPVGGLTWTVHYGTSTSFQPASRLGVYCAAYGGPLLTLLLSGLLLNLGRTTRQARTLATAMTADLAAAKQRAEMLAVVATHITNAVVITDRQRRITWVNTGFTRLTGYTAEEALGRSPAELLQCPETDRTTPVAIRAALGRGEGFHGEILNRNKAGNTYWIDLEIVPLHSTEGTLTGFLGIEVNIDERKQAEARLKSQAARTELALESGALGLWDWHIPSGHTLFDHRWADMLGENLASLRPHVDEWTSRCHPADLPIAQAALQRHFAGETPIYQCRHRMKHRCGTWRWIMDCGKVVARSDDGQPLRMVGTHQDITALHLAQLELERHTNALNHTSRLAQVGSWELEVATQTLTWSDQVRAIHEVPYYYTPELATAIGFYPGEAAITIKGCVQAAIDHGTPFDVELPFVSAQGNHRWVRAVGEAQRMGETTVLVRGALQDITESYRQRQALSVAKDAAEAAARAKAEFLANMSHEIRTPMNAVLGMTELLQNSAITAEQAEFVGIIRSSGDTLLTLINDILDFSKIESGHLELEQAPVNLRDCLESALAISAHAAAGKGLDLLLEIEPGAPPAILGDITRLRQILTNLLSNAVKFTARGEVLVALSAQPGDRLRCAVRDTGIGIPSDRLDRLFKSFSQVDSSTTRHYGGTGLGLAISHRLITLMGGLIWVESTPGQGSTFLFEIPYVATTCPPPSGPGTDPAVLAGRRLLIVDDNANNRRILANQVRSWGLEPHVVDCGSEALRRLDAGERFDAALIDVQMPAMDGFALAAELRRRLPASQLPLLALTSLGTTAQAFAGLDVARVISKPARAAVLQAALCELFAPTPVPVSTPTPLRPAVSLAPAQPLRILLAEDIELNQQVAVLLLGRLGYTAQIANHGQEALEAIAREPVDVLFLDMQMPVMDGLTCATRLCAEYPPATRPWIVAMTANALEGDREKCLAAGMDDYISKPISGQSITDALARAVEALRQRRTA